MEKTSGYLREKGLVWRSLISRKTLREQYLENEAEVALTPNYELNKLVYLFRKKGCLLLNKQGEIAKKLEENGNKLPYPIEACFHIHLEMEKSLVAGKGAFYKPFFEVIYNTNLDQFIEDETNIQLKESYLPGYQLKSLFNKEETEWELRDQVLSYLAKEKRNVERVLKKETQRIIDELINHCTQFDESEVQ